MEILKALGMGWITDKPREKEEEGTGSPILRDLRTVPEATEGTWMHQ